MSNTSPKRPPVPRPRAPVIELSSSRPRQDTPAPSSGFNATIEGASLADLVQLECMRGLTRAVHVTAHDAEGMLYFDQGQLVHAECGRLRGEAAALHVLSWETGTVKPSSKMWVHDSTILTSWQGLLMQAAQHKDETVDVTEVEEIEPNFDDTFISHRADNDPSPTAPAVEAEKEPQSLPTDTEFSDPGIIRAIRLDSEGGVLSSVGDASDFADAASYAIRLAQLIGEGLGLEEFQGMECVTQGKTMLTYVEDESLVAVEAKNGTDVSKLRKRAGL